MLMRPWIKWCVQLSIPGTPPAPRCLQEFESTDAAAALMGSDWREQTFFGEHRMHFEYARSRQEGPVVQDWACELCQYVNFAR